MERLNETVVYEKDSNTNYPPYGHSDSIDIVSEGVLTLKRIVELAKRVVDRDYSVFDEYLSNDSASKISEVLFEKASDIDFYVGHGINMDHIGLIDSDDKFMMINDLIAYLKKMNKTVHRYDY